MHYFQVHYIFCGINKCQSSCIGRNFGTKIPISGNGSKQYINNSGFYIRNKAKSLEVIIYKKLGMIGGRYSLSR